MPAQNDYRHPEVPDLTDQIRFDDLRPLSYGGQADVYLGTWGRPEGDLYVALKIVRVIDNQDRRIRRRFKREVSVWRRLVHPNVQPLLGLCFKISPLPAMVSPWRSNGDVVKYLKSLSAIDGGVLQDTKYRLLIEIMEGLNYLHRNGVIHGDLKGANVLVDDNGSARLCDFGLSAMLLACSVSFSHQTLKGTCRWMAPELLVDDNPEHTFFSDIWAVGGVIVEVLGGVTPYHTKRNDQQVILALARHELPERPNSMEIGGLDWGLVEGCYKQHPADRPPADIVLAELRLQRALAAAEGIKSSDDEPRPISRLAFSTTHSAGAQAMRALAHGALLPNGGLYSHLCRLVQLCYNFLEQHPIAGFYKEELSTALWSLLVACLVLAASGNAFFVPDLVVPTASAVLGALQLIDWPFRPPSGWSTLDSSGWSTLDSGPLQDVLEPPLAAVLQKLLPRLQPPRRRPSVELAPVTSTDDNSSVE